MKGSTIRPTLGAVVRIPIAVALGALCLVAFAGPAAAQDSARVRQQGKAGMSFMLQPLTIEQLRARAASEIVAAHVAAIAYAKARGETPAHYAEYLARTFAPSWGPPNSYRSPRFFRSLMAAWMTWPETVIEPLSVEDTLVTARVRRGYLTRFAASGQLYGVTGDEFDGVLRLFTKRLATYVGLRYDDRTDGEWLHITIAGVGSAAPPAGFPAGTYSATIAQLPERPDLVGKWAFAFDQAGRVTVWHDGEEVARGEYTTWLDQFAFGDDEGALACHAPGGTYRWSRGQQGAITFARLSESCEGRRLVLSRTFNRAP